MFVPQIGNRSSGCWLAQFVCDTCAQATGEIEKLSRCRPTKERRCDRQRNWSRHSTRLVTLHVFLVRPDIKTLSANTSPRALTDQTPQTPRHSQTGQLNTLHKHVQTPRHRFPDATANTDIRAPMLHLCICALSPHIYAYIYIYISARLCIYIPASSRLCICISALSRLCIYAPMHLRLTANPNFHLKHAI